MGVSSDRSGLGAIVSFETDLLDPLAEIIHKQRPVFFGVPRFDRGRMTAICGFK